MSLTFFPGQRWVSHTEPKLGLGLITEVSGRRVSVSFPAAAQERSYAIDQAPLTRVIYQAGEQVKNNDDQSLTIIESQENRGLFIYSCIDEQGEQRVVPEIELSCFVKFTSPQQRLFGAQLDSGSAYRLRIRTLELINQLQQSPANGLLGSRTSLLAHQIYIASEVARRYAPRVLLADEVGLGKTIEAGMIIHQQLHIGMSSRILIVVPPGLIHQWLVEMRRRFNLNFSLFDQERIEAIKYGNTTNASDDGLLMEDSIDAPEQETINPFETEQLVLCPLDLFTDQPGYLQDIEAAGFDLLVVDEAHHLAWSPEQASIEYQAVQKLSQICAGVLLLTATPESIGIDSHFAQLALLDISRFYDLNTFKNEQKNYIELNHLVQTLTNNLANSIDNQFQLSDEIKAKLTHYLNDLDNQANQISSTQAQSWITQLVDRHGTSRVLFRNTRAAIGGFPARELICYPLVSPKQYQTLKGRMALYPETQLKGNDWLKDDPRIDWLTSFAQKIRPQKALVICAHAQTAVQLEHYLHLSLGIACAAFHEGLSIVERDRAAAYFAQEDNGAQLLICSEIGSEGRNFQFATHLVLFDLPLNPDLLEQRIGRLDRIGQKNTIMIHVPYLQDTAQEVLVRWYDEGLSAFTQTCPAAVKLFEQFKAPLIEHFNCWPDSKESFTHLISDTNAALQETRQQMAAGRDPLLELNSCKPALANKLIDRIKELEAPELINDYLVQVFDEFNIEHEEVSENILVLKPTEQMFNDVFPGLKSGQMSVTTDRETALQREELEFLTFEHPMVSEIMEMIQQGDKGNTTIASLAVKSLKPGSILVEVYYAATCIAPGYMQLERYLPLSLERLFLDEKGRDLSKVVSHKQLNQHARKVNRQAAQSGIKYIRPAIERILEIAQQKTQPELDALKNQAIAAHEASLSQEVARLKALQKVNPGIRENEIHFFESQISAAKQYLQRANYSIQAIRVIISN